LDRALEGLEYAHEIEIAKHEFAQIEYHANETTRATGASEQW